MEKQSNRQKRNDCAAMIELLNISGIGGPFTFIPRGKDAESGPLSSKSTITIRKRASGGSIEVGDADDADEEGKPKQSKRERTYHVILGRINEFTKTYGYLRPAQPLANSDDLFYDAEVIEYSRRLQRAWKNVNEGKFLFADNPLNELLALDFMPLADTSRGKVAAKPVTLLQRIVLQFLRHRKGIRRCQCKDFFLPPNGSSRRKSCSKPDCRKRDQAERDKASVQSMRELRKRRKCAA